MRFLITKRVQLNFKNDISVEEFDLENFKKDLVKNHAVKLTRDHSLQTVSDGVLYLIFEGEPLVPKESQQ